MIIKFSLLWIFVVNFFDMVIILGSSEASSPVHAKPNQLDLLGEPKTGAPSQSTNGL